MGDTRVRTIRRVIDRPSDVWLAGRMIGWSLILPPLARFVPLTQLTESLARSAQRRRRARDPEQIVLLARAIFGRSWPLRDNCLVRSLLTYRFLVEAGADVRLRAQVAERSHDGRLVDHRFGEHAVRLELHAIADLRRADLAAGPDDAVAADLRGAQMRKQKGARAALRSVHFAV